MENSRGRTLRYNFWQVWESFSLLPRYYTLSSVFNSIAGCGKQSHAELLCSQATPQQSPCGHPGTQSVTARAWQLLLGDTGAAQLSWPVWPPAVGLGSWGVHTPAHGHSPFTPLKTSSWFDQMLVLPCCNKVISGNKAAFHCFCHYYSINTLHLLFCLK